MMNHYVRTYEQARRAIDDGLQRYMVKVYAHLSGALLVTALAAAVTLLYTPLTRLLFNFNAWGKVSYTGLGWVVAFAPLGIAMYIGDKWRTITLTHARFLLMVYAALTGMSLSSLAFLYTIDSLYKTFLITAVIFGIMSLYGCITNRDLSSVGSFCIMAAWGLLISSLVNLLFQSGAIHFITSCVGVIVFTLFVAYDTQRLKKLYYEMQDSFLAEQVAFMGAFSLYLNFLNIFLYLLRFLGESRRRD